MHRFGKRPPRTDYRTLRFKNYLSEQLPAPPASYNALEQVYQQLGKADPTALFPMDGNDQYGDCTIAALAHAQTVYKGRLAKESILPQQAVEKLYFRLTGGVDSGLAELDVLNYWRHHTVGGDKILAYAKIDPKNHTSVQQAVQLFGGVYLGFQVPQDCIQQFQAGQPWTPGPLLNEGHAVFAVGYDQNGVTVLTWGNTQIGTWAWWDECVDEAYAILPPEAKLPNFSPGWNYQQLVSDLQAVAHE